MRAIADQQLTDAETERLSSSKYKFIKPIGYGAYSVVWLAENKETHEKVAIKQLLNVFRTVSDAKHVLREIRILKHFSHENIIGLKDIIKPAQPWNEFDEVLLVFELMHTDLSKVIASQIRLEKEHYKFIIYQILRGLKYIHSANVIHRDLKPNNLLMHRNCELKRQICDFGMGRGNDAGGRDLLKMTCLEDTTTRWYRAPEGLYDSNVYTTAVDVWSAGCIFGELLLREPLFPGTTTYDMLELIFNYLGTPSPEEADKIPSAKYRQFVKSLPPKSRQPITKAFPGLAGADPEALDLLEKMLVLDPEKRITVAEALQHPFLESLHDPNDEPTASGPFVYPYQDVTDIDLYRELIYKELTLPIC